MLEDHLPVDNLELFGAQGLESYIQRACLARILDDRRKEPAEGLEDCVLHIDPERQATVQELLDRRQVFFHRAIRLIERQPGHLLEFRVGTGFDLARPQLVEELPQRRPCIGALEVVLGAEHVLPAGLALSLGDGPESVEAARDGREKALLTLHIGRHRPEQWRLHLIGAVRAPQPLDRIVGFPTRLEQVMHPEALVLGPKIGVIAAPRAPGIREDQDALGIIHEGLRLAEI